jgi:hypothetical protein
MTTTLTVRAKPEDLARVETIITEFSAAGGGGDSSHFGRAFRMAAAIRALHNAITDEMMKDLMHLQGTTLGFLTDKDDPAKNNPPGYPAAEVKLVAIEAALLGAYWVGNEFNIISNRPYLTKNFFTRKLREFPGLTDLKLSPGVPVLVGDKGALVPYVATWKLNGKDMRIERLLRKLDDKSDLDERIPIRVNSGMGADAILGKAERKLKAQIYNLLTGSDLTDGDVDEVPGKVTPVKGLDDLTERLEGNGAAGEESSSGQTQEPTSSQPDAQLLDEARSIFAAAFEDGRLSTVTKAEEEMRNKAHDEPTRVAISNMADETRQRIKSSPSYQKGQKQRDLVKS